MVDLTSVFVTIRIDTDADFFGGLNVADTDTLLGKHIAIFFGCHRRRHPRA
jgi:hypothetical protein